MTPACQHVTSTDTEGLAVKVIMTAALTTFTKVYSSATLQTVVHQ